MKPSTRLSESVIKMGGRTSGAGTRVSTLHLAIASCLLVVAALVSVASGSSTAATTAAASKSGQRGAQVVAGGGRPSSSSSSSSLSPVSDVAINLDKDDQLALPSSTTNARLVPVRHSQSSTSSSARSSTRNTDLSMGQSNIANAKVHLSPKDMNTAAGHHYGGGHGHGKYYMYAESPKKGAYKMGFKRGNGKHVIERKEHAHKGHVSSYFKWHDKKGKGSHKFEFKHYDKKGKHHY